MEFMLIFIIVIILLISAGFMIFLSKKEYWSKKHTYKIVWRYDEMCPNSTVLIEAKSPAKAWQKLQKQHALPIDFVCIEELRQ